jgi:hypothetical protein
MIPERSRFILLGVLLIAVLMWSGASPAATDVRSLLPTKELPSGWILVDGPRTYTRKNLFEHVDGQAVLYITYGFQRSVFAVFQKGKGQEGQIEVDICDMGATLHAFGIFSRFRSDDCPGKVGLESHVDEHSLYFYKGRYFVMLYATEKNEAILKKLAEAISSRILDASPPPKEIGLFPRDGLKSGSIQYFPEGLLGYDFLGRGFRASYITQGEDGKKVEAKAQAEVKAQVKDNLKTERSNPSETWESKLFLAIFKTPQEATAALKVFKNYVSRAGKIVSGPPSGFGSDAWIGEDPYQGQLVVLQMKSYLLGAAGFNGEDGALFLRKFIQRIR